MNITRKFNRENLTGITIGLDFDGTCISHGPNICKDIGAAPIIKRLINEFNVKIILYTMRCDKLLDEALMWFNDNDIILYDVNNNPTQKEWTSSPKIFAQLYIDDLNLGIPLIYSDKYEKPHVDWKELEKLLFYEIDKIH